MKEPIIYPKVESNKTLNLFDEFDYEMWPESNSEQQWYSSDNYTLYYKSRLAKKHKYTQNSITYKFNSLGFRVPSCNFPMRFEDAYDYPTFMVAGCSYTEGVGLPEDQLWHSYLIEKFVQNNDTRRPIAKLNIGKAARGIDAIVRYIYVSIERYGAKPDMIYLLLPNIIRREIILEDENLPKSPSIFLLLPNIPIPKCYPDVQKEEIDMNFKLMLNIRQSYHKAFQSLLFLKYYLEKKNIPWFFSSWSMDFSESGIKEYFSNINLNDIKIPEVLKQHHNDINFSDVNVQHKYHMARDGMHWGANFHHAFANKVYDSIINSSMFLGVKNKWKT
jgi:hypothetical protein